MPGTRTLLMGIAVLLLILIALVTVLLLRQPQEVARKPAQQSPTTESTQSKEEAASQRKPAAQEVLQSFRDAGLEVGSAYNLDDDPSWQSGPVPKTSREAYRFPLPSLGEDPNGNDKGGRVFIFDSPKDLKPVRDYYQGFTGMLASHVYVNNAETVLVQLPAGDVPKAKADQYGAVLKEKY